MTRARFRILPGPVPYADGVALQEDLVRRRVEDRIPDTLLLLQHTPVITLGRRGRTDFLTADPGRLAAEGVEIHRSSRGGDVTYHGPGQWVLYPILKLGRNERGAHGYLNALEDVALGVAEAFGVRAFRREGMAGAWCGRGKLAAVGFKFTRWVTHHGLSFNVDPDPWGFDWIVGCGLVGETVTSLRRVLGPACPSMAEAAKAMRREAGRALDRELETWEPEAEGA